MPTRPEARTRLSAHERRIQILRAAIPLFAEHGYAAGTAAIAERAGISHPYLFRLFPTKKHLFLACCDAVTLRMRAVLADAVASSGAPDARLDDMARAFAAEIDPDERGLQLQMLSAAGDPEIRAAALRGLGALVSDAARLSEAGPHAVARFCGGLLLAAAAERLELDDPVMSGMHFE